MITTIHQLWCFFFIFNPDFIIYCLAIGITTIYFTQLGKSVYFRRCLNSEAVDVEFIHIAWSVIMCIPRNSVIIISSVTVFQNRKCWFYSKSVLNCFMKLSLFKEWNHQLSVPKEHLLLLIGCPKHYSFLRIKLNREIISFPLELLKFRVVYERTRLKETFLKGY
jgi:hypothetical protein